MARATCLVPSALDWIFSTRAQKAGGNLFGGVALRRHHQQVLFGFCEDNGNAVVPLPVGQRILAYVVVAHDAVAPKFGIWSPQLTAAMEKQWFTLHTSMGDYDLNRPIFQFSMDNSFEFGHDWVASIDAWLTTIGDQENGSFTGNTGSLNVSLTKTFFDERLSIRLQGYDLLGTEKNKMLSYFDGIQTKQIGWSDSREIGLTVRYKFNTTRSKYKGTGAGNEEKNRL